MESGKKSKRTRMSFHNNNNNKLLYAVWITITMTTTTTTTLFGDYHMTLQLSRVGAQVRVFAPVNTSWYIQNDGVSWKIILCHIIIQTCDFRVKSSNPPDVRSYCARSRKYYKILSCVRFDWKYFAPVSRVGCASIYTHTKYNNENVENPSSADTNPEHSKHVCLAPFCCTYVIRVSIND